MSKKSKVQHDSFETVESALTRTEQYIEENRKSLTIIIVAILAVVGLFIGYKNFYLEPKEVDAQSQMFMAEKYFEIDSFLYALEGDDQYPGFLEIIDDYAATKAANLAQYYAGICYLKLGEYEDAIEYLEDFDANDMMISIMAVGATGDAYVELDELEKGASFYVKAANLHENEVLSPIYLFKAGLVEEELGNFKKAISFYKEIKEKYPQSNEAKTIEKYIISAELKM